MKWYSARVIAMLPGHSLRARPDRGVERRRDRQLRANPRRSRSVIPLLSVDLTSVSDALALGQFRQMSSEWSIGMGSLNV